ncbi:hypothetical protein HY636_02795 [Candidatus Woesearchaeota archaeon]|nr:hypothetical protein [Candidatus Woesearchaeota archaeon]
MSLEDKFYPDDGSYLTKFDNFMIKAAKEVGILYQNLTGDSYKNLASIIYKASAVGLGLSALCGHILGIPLSMASFSSSKQHFYQTPLEEEITCEALGLGKKMGKLMRICLLSVGFSVFSMGYSYYKDNTNKKLSVFDIFLVGCLIEAPSICLYTFAEYLTKSDMPDPPEKNIFQETSERIKRLLSPEPLPTQVQSANNTY